MPRGAVFCGTTAARIYGLPLPQPKKPTDYEQFFGISTSPDGPYVQQIADDEPELAKPIHVGVAANRPQPVAKGVTGRRLAAALLPGTTFGGLPVLSPLATFFSCCRELSVTDAVVMLESLLTDKEIYPGLRIAKRPVHRLEHFTRGLAGLERTVGVTVAREAIYRARLRVASPMESRLRLLLVDAGLPEPEINVPVLDGDGNLVAEVDLLYRDARLIIEYEGDGHRTDAKTFRKDLERERRLRARGFEYVRVTVEVMRNGGRALVADLRRQLADRIRTLSSQADGNRHV